MATDELIARDAVVRQAAFDHVHPLRSRDLELSHEDIARGFMLEGQRWPLWNPQRGIFKPRGMPFLLSSRTVFPRRGGRVWYDDQRQVHQHLRVGSVGDVVAGILQDDGPSIIDYRTLRWSAGQLPLRFLRGCGLSEWEIEATKLYRQALGRDQITDLAYEIARLRGEQPIQFYSCFISYSSQDGEFAQRFTW